MAPLIGLDNAGHRSLHEPGLAQALLEANKNASKEKQAVDIEE